jgi:hypothetical protein|tara:strand:+ start:560 stop:1780 length:1221 start_codon:yes stop_codon:yes gene_type:complete
MKFFFIICTTLIITSACTVSEVIDAERTTLDVASLNISENLLLDVGVVKFDPGIPEENDSDKTGIYEEIREAESRFFPYHIKATLEKTGYWGSVRVIPSRAVITDVIISGRIIRSDGEYASLLIKVEDITGEEWFSREYSTQTGLRSYSESRDRAVDPYQKIFNDFANDLRFFAASLHSSDNKRIQQISELMFFANMVPSVYEPYLSVENNFIQLIRLPPENDPMVQRLRGIRERDRLVVDSINEHYANYYYGVALPYEGWRKKARENQVIIRDTKRAATVRALIGVAVTAGSINMDTSDTSRSRRNIKRATQSVGMDRGIRTIIEAWQLRQSTNSYRAQIGELSESFIAEAAPLVIQVEGQSRRLTGTAESQYEGWRKILKEINQLETEITTTDVTEEPFRISDQ